MTIKLGEEVEQKGYVLVGPPGSGKDMRADILSKHLRYPHISTGNIIKAMDVALRDEIICKYNIKNGELWPDEVINAIVLRRIKEEDCKHGFILNGYPRNVSQANFLKENNINIYKVIRLKCSYAVIRDRVLGRLTCNKCGAVHQVKECKGDTCERCGEKLTKGDDDNTETLKIRLSEFSKKTKFLEEYYKAIIVFLNSANEPNKILEI